MSYAAINLFDLELVKVVENSSEKSLGNFFYISNSFRKNGLLAFDDLENLCWIATKQVANIFGFEISMRQQSINKRLLFKVD